MELKEFIKTNNLTIKEGSGGNIDIATLCGYALYKEFSLEDCKNAIEETDKTPKLMQEIERIYEYASQNDYSTWWATEDAISQYTF